MTTTRRGNPGVVNNSRIAKRYAMPANAKEAMKYGPPRSPKLREQMVSATHNVAPSAYTLHSGVIFNYYNSPVPVCNCVATTSHSRHQPLQGSDSTRVRNACTV
jgi:hypothetical protein